jgi:hypothetical protein
MSISALRALPIVLAPLLVAAALTVACSHDDDDHSHDYPSGHTTAFPACTEITQACHVVDVGEGPIHDCHDLAHGASSEDVCLQKRADCLALCKAANPDAGGSAGACASDARKDVYTAGLSKQGAGLTVKIVDATPAPPAKGTNVMTLQVLDGAGKPLDGASVQVTPFMPDHGHGSAVPPVVTPAGSDGKYAVDKVYLAMAGLWQLTITVTPAGGTRGEVVFSFCLDG